MVIYTRACVRERTGSESVRSRIPLPRSLYYTSERGVFCFYYFFLLFFFLSFFPTAPERRSNNNNDNNNNIIATGRTVVVVVDRAESIISPVQLARHPFHKYWWSQLSSDSRIASDRVPPSLSSVFPPVHARIHIYTSRTGEERRRRPPLFAFDGRA